MITKNALLNLIAFRNELDINLIKGKISPINYAYRTYFFIRQNRLKFVKKAHDLESVVFNYLFWLSRIERRVMIERELFSINPSIASADKLDEINFFFNRRKNQMVRRLLVEFEDQIKIEKAQIIFQDVVELIVNFGEYTIPLYVNKDILDRLKIEVQPINKSVKDFYLPFIFFDLPLKIS